MDKDPEDHNVIIQATAYVPTENHPHSLPSASACALHFPAEVAPFATVIHRPGRLSNLIPLFLPTLNAPLLVSFPNPTTSSYHFSTRHPQSPTNMQFSSPNSPPTTSLPSLPLEAPPATPRNASNLYGQFSWPSLDICTLFSKLEDLAVAEEPNQDQHFPSDDPHEDFCDMLITKYADEDDDIQTQQKVFTDILKLLDYRCRGGTESGIYNWLEGVVGEADVTPVTPFNEYTHVNDDDDEDDNDTINDINAIHDDEWLDDEDRRDMGLLLGWFEGLEEGVRDGMVRVNGRRGRERRMGGVFV
ncbi:MAG: hypothetical protein Q9204_006604 [Flavoplaca sp. TL-2023a]